MSSASETDEYEFLLMRLQRMLETAGHYPSVLKAIQRLFQKVPHLVKEMTDTMEEEGYEDAGIIVPGAHRPKYKTRLIELTVEKVKEICSDVDVSQSLGMASNLSSYIAFLDLVLVK